MKCRVNRVDEEWGGEMSLVRKGEKKQSKGRQYKKW